MVVTAVTGGATPSVAALAQLSPTVLARSFPYLQTGFAASVLAALAASSDLEVADAWSRAVLKVLDPERAAKLFTSLPEDARARISEHLTADLDFLGHVETGKCTCLGKWRQRLRSRPRQRAAKSAAARAQWHGQQFAAGLFQSRAGEADENATVIDPIADLLADVT